MNEDQLIYIVFAIVLTLTITFDLGLLSKSSVETGIKKALYQTLLWVILAFAFWAFLWWQKGPVTALEYISAYLMEWSLSIDNIFVFILIFTFFSIRSDHVARALLVGILIAILLRIVFITIGIALVDKFYWILYVFGAFLIYSGIKIFTAKKEQNFDPYNNPVYRLLTRIVPLINKDVSGRLSVMKDGKRFYTNLFVVIILLATTDIVFALDSIPAVFAISKDKLVIYTSNIFAVLGLRSLYFLLKGAVNKFEYLQQGIAIVLIFIGIKMMAEIINIAIPTIISLMVIIICLFGSIAYSIQYAGKKIKK
ncbi:MAG: TerC/Alx family metal homeostasis membrane protein [Flavisolibacter sp.]